jgi:hypothetical protein
VNPVGDRREATDKDVAVGGAGLGAQAFELALVDELRMFAIRSSSVAARRSCHPSPTTSRWTLIETRTFGSRVIDERYRRARDESE